MDKIASGLRLNLGCGLNAPASWHNFDSSLHAQITRFKPVYRLLRGANLVNRGSCWPANVRYLNLNKKLPWRDGSVEAVYLSHVLEHLSLSTVDLFLAESLRVLKPGGAIRLVVPDMYAHARAYLEATDELSSSIDQLLWAINMGLPQERSVIRRIYNLAMGYPSMHKQMYDFATLSALLSQFGYRSIVRCDHCRSEYLADIAVLEGKGGYDHSLYLEARKPAGGA